MNQAEPQRLAAVDGRVWFLGYGLGGCAGLALLVGALSLAVDKSVWPGLCALALSGLHAGALIYFWLRKATVSSKLAMRVCFLVDAAGILAVAAIMSASQSHVPAVVALYALAIKSVCLAIVAPGHTRGVADKRFGTENSGT